MNEIDVLKAVRETLAAGWCKKRMHDGQKHCIVGALQMIAGNPIWSKEVIAAQDALVKRVPSGRLFYYNDHPNTTLQDMLNLIDRTLADKGAL